nr:putative glycine-tRNA ligase, beta subunit [Tanacetum cinerariifolium]
MSLMVFEIRRRPLSCAESYASVMQQAGISVETERKKMIIERSNDLAKGVDGCVVMKSSLHNALEFGMNRSNSMSRLSQLESRVFPGASKRSPGNGYAKALKVHCLNKQ